MQPKQNQDKTNKSKNYPDIKSNLQRTTGINDKTKPNGVRSQTGTTTRTKQTTGTLGQNGRKTGETAAERMGRGGDEAAT